MKVKKLLRTLDPNTQVIICESNKHKIEQATAKTMLYYYPSDYATWRILNRKISSIQVLSGCWLCIILREEKKDERKNYN